MKNDNGYKVSLNLTLDNDVKIYLKKMALKKDTSVSALVTDMVVKHMIKKKKFR